MPVCPVVMEAVFQEAPDKVVEKGPNTWLEKETVDMAVSHLLRRLHLHYNSAVTSAGSTPDSRPWV